MSDSKQLETITLGGGCFWCVEAVYAEMNGVESAVSGYMGGHVPNPTYEQVCGKETGHAEVVQVTYDADVISYDDLLNVFFTIHDPTTRNRQGNDVGPQYRSAIFYHDEAQKAAAEAKIAEVDAQGLYSNPIVTEVAPLENYYAAESYHQDYYKNNKMQPYCMFVVAPKVSKARKKFYDMLKT